MPEMESSRQLGTGDTGDDRGNGKKMTSVAIYAINVVFAHQALPYAWLI